MEFEVWMITTCVLGLGGQAGKMKSLCGAFVHLEPSFVHIEWCMIYDERINNNQQPSQSSLKYMLYLTYL